MRLVHAIIRCSFCLVGPHLLSRLLHLFLHVLHLTFIYSLAPHFLTFPFMQLFIIDIFCVSYSCRCSFCFVGPHLLLRLLHLLFLHFLHLTFIYSPAPHFLTFPMASPSTPVWYLKKLPYKAQDCRDLVRSIWRALAEVNDMVSQELARIHSTGIIAVIVT